MRATAPAYYPRSQIKPLCGSFGVGFPMQRSCWVPPDGIVNLTHICISAHRNIDQITQLPKGRGDHAWRRTIREDHRHREEPERRDRISGDEYERSARYRVTVNGEEVRTIEVDRTVDYWRTTMRYTLTNAKSTPAAARLRVWAACSATAMSSAVPKMGS